VERHRVSSSAILRVGYEPSSAVLEIEFEKGGVYRYFDVPEPVFRELLEAPSIGQYFLANVRDVFRYAKV
jgi:hypothetical protein